MEKKTVAYEQKIVAYEQKLVAYEAKIVVSEQSKGDSSGGGGFEMSKCSSCNCKDCNDWRKGMEMEMAAMQETIEQLKRNKIIKPARATKSPETEEKKKQEEEYPRLPVDIYKKLKKKKIDALNEFIRKKKTDKDVFLGLPMNFRDFKEMMNKTKWLWDIYVEATLTMMRERHLKYPYHYDESDIILDMAFLTNMKKHYYNLEEESEKEGLSFELALRTYAFDDDFLEYAHGKKPYPTGRSWVGAKRIFAIFNINDNHYVTCLFDMVEAKVFLYDCNHGCNVDERFLSIITPILYMFPIYVRNSKLFKELEPKCKEFDMWDYEKVPKAQCPQNLTAKSCGVFALMYIEHLLTNTPLTNICDNLADEWRKRLAVCIHDGKMKP